MLMSWGKTQLVRSLVLKSAVISVRLDSFLCEESFGGQAASGCLSPWAGSQQAEHGSHTVSKVTSFSDNSVTGVTYQQGN